MAPRILLINDFDHFQVPECHCGRFFQILCLCLFKTNSICFCLCICLWKLLFKNRLSCSSLDEAITANGFGHFQVSECHLGLIPAAFSRFPGFSSLPLRRLRCHFFRWSRASWEAEGAWCLEMGTSESLASQIGLLKILKIGILKILKYVNREFRSWDKYCHLSTSSADLGLVYTGKYREGHRIPS